MGNHQKQILFHQKLQRSAGHDLLVSDCVVLNLLAVQLHAFDMNTFCGLIYCGFIEPEEGWMVHFDLVSGNQGAGLTTSNKINGETTYEVGSEQYKVYSGQGSDEEHYWDCVGVYRVA